MQIFPLTVEELGDGLDIGRACVLVANRRREEFQEMLAGFIASRAMIAGTGNSDGRMAGMISPRDSLTNYESTL